MRSLCGLVLLLLACTTAVAGDEEKNEVVHGTINVVLANKNGIVVLTDSMLTRGSNEQLKTPGKKLFRLDDRSVCAIAGIIASPSGSYKKLDLSTVALVDDYARKISVGPPISIQQKLTELAFLLNINLSAVENVLNANGNSIDPNRYTLELIVAGYDVDGLPKIGKLILHSQKRGDAFDSKIEAGSIRVVSDRLDTELGGMPDKARLLLGHPETVTNDEAVSVYQASLKADGGRSLTLEQMASLAKQLKDYSAVAHPEVGGPDQIAILQAGKITSFSQPPFPNSAPALIFSLIIKSSFSGAGIALRGKIIFVRCSFDSMYVPMADSFLPQMSLRTHF